MSDDPPPGAYWNIEAVAAGLDAVAELAAVSA